MKVVVSEKPSVAKDLAKVLKANQKKEGHFVGNGYCVTWAFGHLIQLAYPESYSETYKSWNLADLPIIPDDFKKQIVDDTGVKRQFSIISSLLNHADVTEVICATDAGREGELIFRFIMEFAKCEKPIKRLWISSQTDKAIKEGFDALKAGEEYVPLFHSAISRAEADWLIGMNATRAYTIKFSRGAGVMSVGRVQTPVLKMIVDRVYENESFIPETFYELNAEFLHVNGAYKGKWQNKDKETRLSKKEDAEALLKKCQSASFAAVQSLTQKEKKEKPPLLYDLTELQRDANKRFKFSADATLKLMQNLYEKHKVLTYPRTSSRYLSSDLVPKLKGLVTQFQSVSEYSELANATLANGVKTNNRIVDDAKVTDHHAIIPTDKSPNLGELSPDERKIYDLVLKRFFSVFLGDCVKHQTDILTDLAGEVFKSTGIMISVPGWRAAYGAEAEEKKPARKKKSKTDDGEEDDKTEGEGNLLPAVQKGDAVEPKSVQVSEGQTKAPPLYNEASILSAMETAGKGIEDEELREAMKECGLGTPATRAQILERLIQVKYIVRDKNKLVPTDKGKQIIKAIQDESLVSPELTGTWEKRLNDMAKAKFSRDQFMADIRDFARQIIEKVEKASPWADRVNLGICPLCQKGHVVETPKAYGCTEWKNTGCKFAIWKEVAGRVLSLDEAKSLVETGKTAKLSGFKSKTGKLFDAALVLQNGRTQFLF